MNWARQMIDGIPDNSKEALRAVYKRLIKISKPKHKDAWEDKSIIAAKSQIKELLKIKHKHQCCYCRRSFVGEFNMVIDIEHVLPKEKFPEWIFEIENLSLSCKRCNMNVKNDDIEFYKEQVGTYSRDSDAYKIIHPNYDDWNLHMKYFCWIENDLRIIKYVPLANSSKAAFTYAYMRLDELEIKTLNISQGRYYDPNDDLVALSNYYGADLVSLLQGK